MNEQRLPEAASKGEDEHEGVVESETTHVVIAIEGATTVGKVFIRAQQTAVIASQVFDEKLISTIRESIDKRVSIPCIEISDRLSLFLVRGP